MGNRLMTQNTELPKIVQSLVQSWGTLVLKGTKKIEDVPETYTLSSKTYALRDLVEINIAERTIAALY